MKNVYTLFIAILVVLVSCQKPTEKKEEVYKPVNSNVKLESFPYVPPGPINGTVYGLVEIGGSGFNSFIIEKDDVDRWKLVKAEYGESKVLENEATTESIQSGLETFVGKMIDKGVAKESIYFVQSSTAGKNEKVQSLNPILKGLGYNVITVSVEEESYYAFLATIPVEFSDEAYVIDLGSGNTKISWITNDSVKSVGTYGSKYFQKEIADKDVYDEVFKIVSGIPEKNRKKCFIIGGAPYKLAMENEDFAEHFTVLKSPDAYTSEDPKTLAGLNIYKAALDASPESEGFIFDWYSNFTIGYLLSEI